MEPSKPLSILCKNFSDIQTYTLGFPSTSSGQDTFRLARRVLPGPVRLFSQSSPKDVLVSSCLRGDAQAWLLTRPTGCLADNTSTEATVRCVHEWSCHMPDLIQAFACLHAVHADSVRQQEDAKAVPGLPDRPVESQAHRGSAHAWRPNLPGGCLQPLASREPISCAVHASTPSSQAFQGLFLVNSIMPCTCLPMAALRARWVESSALRSTPLNHVQAVSPYHRRSCSAWSGPC